MWPKNVNQDGPAPFVGGWYDENSTEWMVSERLPNERVVLAEQAAYTIRQSAGQIPEDLERADGNDSESAVDV
jgi:hypothetical protein